MMKKLIKKILSRIYLNLNFKKINLMNIIIILIISNQFGNIIFYIFIKTIKNNSKLIISQIFHEKAFVLNHKRTKKYKTFNTNPCNLIS